MYFINILIINIIDFFSLPEVLDFLIKNPKHFGV